MLYPNTSVRKDRGFFFSFFSCFPVKRVLESIHLHRLNYKSNVLDIPINPHYKYYSVLQ